MNELRTPIVALGLSLVALHGCTQAVDAQERQAEGLMPPATLMSQRAESASFLDTDWSGNVKTQVFHGPFTGLNPHNIAKVTLPGDWVLISGHYELELGANSSPGALLVSSFPSRLQANTWIAESRAHVLAHPHKLRAIGIGLQITGLTANQLRQKIQIVKADGAPGHASEAIAQLPPGMLLIGGGAGTAFGGAGHFLTATQPWMTNSWRAVSKDHMVADTSGFAVAYAIGIQQCPTGGPPCLASRWVGAGKTCGLGYCWHGAIQSHPAAWAITAVGGASTYNGAGRILAHMGIGTGVDTFVSSKDHVAGDIGMLFGYLAELQQAITPPPN